MELILGKDPPLELNKIPDDLFAEGQVARSLFVLAEGIASRSQFFQLVHPGDHLPVEGRKSDIGCFLLTFGIHGFDWSF